MGIVLTQAMFRYMYFENLGAKPTNMFGITFKLSCNQKQNAINVVFIFGFLVVDFSVVCIVSVKHF